MARPKKNTQDYFDYQFNRNLKPVKRYKFFDKIFKIKNKSAATIIAEHCYTRAMDIMDGLDYLEEKEEDEITEQEAKEIMEIQIETTNLVKEGLAALIGMENMEYIFDYEDEDGAGLDIEDLMVVFTEIYMIAKGGNPDDANFRDKNKEQQ